MSQRHMPQKTTRSCLDTQPTSQASEIKHKFVVLEVDRARNRQIAFGQQAKSEQLLAAIKKPVPSTKADFTYYWALTLARAVSREAEPHL